MPVLVRNAQRGPTVFSDESTKQAFEWGGAGDPTGNDVQQVPESLLENVAFLRAINRGVLVVEQAPPHIQESLSQHAAPLATQSTAWQDKQAQAMQEARAAIAEEVQEDLVQVTCVGPATRGDGACDQPIAVKDRTRNEKPPLCNQHAHLEPQYVMTHAEELGDDGQPVILWTRAQIDSRT